MSALTNTPVVLVMRHSLGPRFDHLECMSRLGLEIHLVSESAAATADPRFATVTLIDSGSTTEDLAEATERRIHESGARCAVTYLEADIVAVGEANARAGVPWARPATDAIARDKRLQRLHLAKHPIPSPSFLEVRDEEAAIAALADLDGPWIVKPTRGGNSAHVVLASDHHAVRAALSGIRAFANSRVYYLYDDLPDVWALIEEYLPGDEVTCDGVVIDGHFHLGGIHAKYVGPGPCFEEDLYTLPLPDDRSEEEIVGVVAALVASLDLVHALFNVELRRGRDGRYHVVEFSTRISGGHVYRNILDVHAIDLVELHLLALLHDPDQAASYARQRHPGRMATCIRFVYRTGIVAENSAGPAAQDPAFRAYYPLAAVGDAVAAAPAGFDMCGLLSVRERLTPGEHPERIHATARRVEQLLSLRVTSADPVAAGETGPA